MGVSGYDEPLGLPTEEANMLSLRTQQILAHETGVASVADPLGGSYYVEWLTDTLERDIQRVTEDIKKRGGILDGVDKGWLLKWLTETADKYQQEVEKRERIAVGVNAFTLPAEEEGEQRVYVASEEEIQRQIAKVKELRRNRDHEKVARTLKELYEVAASKQENLFPALIEAAKAYATSGEMFGVIRMAYGLSFDPLGQVKYPFKLEAGCSPS